MTPGYARAARKAWFQGTMHSDERTTGLAKVQFEPASLKPVTFRGSEEVRIVK